ncbi:hypothetical protein RclHR1_01780006 [Rhizophagus clarus]|uniref:Accessory Sec-dependent serine-rich glycoprotein adhesin n=1 Tax=Rhizophagus clarus TaxID=94130 RepID=A0A2Z6QY80_9GLOM|nr:hypothetical protein RclHR1_01780006 [Rhizophagus clarus]GES89844.1 accessory Sec-dependent serine-rich glycoprotein adhesin [Rhizophagus clarus]
MTKFVREPREILKKYRKTEPSLLVFFRGLCLTVLLVILFIYFVILTFFVATDHPILSKVLIPKPYILAPVVKISSKYEFSIACEFNYLDFRTPTDEDRANCNKYIVPTNCAEQDPNNTFDGHCVGLFNPPIQDKFNFSLPDKRYGISFLITITDAAYDATNDNGMQIRVYDQLFNPSQLPNSVTKTISSLDPFFLDRLENSNLHIMGYHQVNKMYVSRKTKRFQIPTFFSVLGIPPSYFPQPFIESNYESVQVPSIVSSFTTNTYGSLFVGTLDWTEEIQTELRSSNVLDSFALLAAFYGLLVGIYVCLFGWSAILPWGICQITCCKHRSKSNLREKFPRGIPVISPLQIYQPKLERIEALEKFIKLFLVNVADQANREPKPQSIEDGEETIPDKEKPKFRPSSFLSILNTAPMTRPNSTRPNSTRPVSSNTQENQVTPNVPSIPEAKENSTTANVPPSNNRPPSNRLSFFLPKFPKSGSPDKGKSKALSPNDTLSTTNDSPTESKTGIPSFAPNKKVPNSTNLPTGLESDILSEIPFTGAPDGKSSTSKNLPSKSETGVSSTTPNKKDPDSTHLPTGSETDNLSTIPYTGGAPDGKSSTSKNLLPKTGVPSITPSKKVPDSTHLPTESETDNLSTIPYTGGAPDGKSSTSKNLPPKSETGVPSITLSTPSKKVPDSTHLPTESETEILSAIPYIGAPHSKSSTTKNSPPKSEINVPSTSQNKKVPDSTHLPTGSETDILSAIPYIGAPHSKSSTTKNSDSTNLPTGSDTDILSAIPYIGAPHSKSSTTKNSPPKLETDVPTTNKKVPDSTHLPSGSETDILSAGAPESKSSNAKNLPTKSVTGIPSIITPNEKIPESTDSQTGSETPYTGAPDSELSSAKNLPTKSVTGIPSIVTPNEKIPESTDSQTGSGTDISSTIPFTGAPDSKSSTIKNLPTKSETGVSSITPNVNENDNIFLPNETEKDVSSFSSEKSENIRKSAVYVDEKENPLIPEKAENIRKSMIYVDEQGNSLTPEEVENIRKSVVYVDEKENPLTPEKAESVRKSIIYVDEQGNSLTPEEVENIRKSVVYVDEKENPLIPEKAESIRKSIIYVDEQGNSLTPEEVENIRKSVVYVDEKENPLIPEKAENIRKSIIYVDEQGNSLTPEEVENIRKSVVYVDEKGNSLTPEEAENIRNSIVYVDEKGNPLTPEEAENIRNSVVYVDEKGNSLTPEKAENIRNSVVYVDEKGNPLTPEEAENIRNSVVYVDEKGNPLTPEEVKNIRNSVTFMEDNDEIEELNQEVYIGEGSSKSTEKYNLKDSVTNRDENKNPINLDDIPASSSSSKSTLLLPLRLKKLFKKNKK